MKRFMLVSAMIVIAVSSASFGRPGVGSAQVCSQHTFLGDRPTNGTPGWHQEAQGLAHDSDYWYITQNPAFECPFICTFTCVPDPDCVTNRTRTAVGGGPNLWRIPVEHDLNNDVACDDPGVSCKDLFDTEQLYQNSYNHFGDPDFYQVGGRGYILVPIESGDPNKAGVAIFRADATLEFLAFAPFPGQTHSGWVAVDPDGFLLSSESETSLTRFNRFYINWPDYQTHEDVLTIAPRSPILLEDETGPLTLEEAAAQGGEFDDLGQLLYFSNGHGVHVFRTRAGSGAECASAGEDPCIIARRIEHSHNRCSPPCEEGFWFGFETDIPRGFSQEPEGLTFWDLDADHRAPTFNSGDRLGQLHVILLENHEFSDDGVFVKHYRRSLADPDAPLITCPADTVAECSAHSGVAAADPQLSSFFAGASATDTCDFQPALGNTAPAFFNLGTTPVTFTATDHSGNAASCVGRVTVQDTRPPAIVCPPPITVECTGSSGISAGDSRLASFFNGVSASDTCDAAPSISNDAPAFLPLGTTAVTFAAADHSTNASSCGSRVTVADTTPPQISVVVTPVKLWPPNHEMIPVTARVTVSDRCDASVTFKLVSITSNEPDDALGDGDTSGDIQDAQFGTPDTTFALRAERSGRGAGRIYTILYRAEDASGNQSTATALVRVPHN